MEENQVLLDKLDKNLPDKSDNELFCPKCGEVPEFLNINTSNSKIELKCKICGVYEQKINEYYKDLKDSKYSKINCLNCRTNYYINNDNDNDNDKNKVKDNNTKVNIYYCYECKNNFCEKCKNKHLEHNNINFNEKKYYCLKHYNEKLKYFCLDDQENICEQELESLHKDHNIKEISELKNFVEKFTKKIEKTNRELIKIFKFNNLILRAGEVSNNNYFHLKSIINLGKSFEQGYKIDSKDINCLFNQLIMDIKFSKDANEGLKNKNIQLSRNEKHIHLNKRDLDDQDFRYISQIRFNQLKEIDISENNITSIENFKKMSLPFLEFLNLSHNKIKHIEPITKLKYKNLKYIYLQGNEIEDIESFLNTDFSSLDLLRVEDNKEVNENNEKIKQLDKKFSKKIILKSIKTQIKEFLDNYNLEISKVIEENSEKNLAENSNENKTEDFALKYSEGNKIDESNLEKILENIVDIELNDLSGGNEMLQSLFLIFTYKSKNRIRKLILRNNLIKDPLILTRINFDKLRTLDLAVNKIKDLKFISGLKAKYLKYLYLDNNSFNDIYPILSSELPHLEVISLNKNNFECEENKLIPGFDDLEKKKPENGNDFTIQWKEPINYDKEQKEEKL